MNEQDKMNDLIDKVHQWGVDRKIIGNGKLETQWLKLLSEFGEMCDTLAKGGDPIDDIGDQLVVMIMMAGIGGKSRGLPEMISASDFEGDTMRAVRKLCILCGQARHLFLDTSIELCLDQLGVIAANHNHTLYQCLEHSYNQIKDRKGYLNEQGVFVKE